jgi:hypothetical protein
LKPRKEIAGDLCLRQNTGGGRVRFTSLFPFFPRVRVDADPLHAMPPGGFRLGVINGFDLAAALSARARLEDHFRERQAAPLALQG